MAKFRKKPVVIDAWQFDDEDFDGRPDWLTQALRDGSVHYRSGVRPYLLVETLEGNHRGDLGDWIIRGVKGELYPCKPDIFALTYDPE